jgi:RND family efflux transporter MFP subunit
LWLVFVSAATLALPASGAEIDGFTEPYRDIDVAAPEMGQLVSLEVCEGDRVSEGHVLARLNGEVLHATLEIAKAAMESAGRLEAAEAELRMYQDSLEKLEKLLERNHATPREVFRAQAQKDMAAARVKAAREDLTVKTLEYERACTQVEQRRVVSPIDGLVTQVYKDEGEFVSPSDPVVVRVVQLDPLLVVFSVPVAAARTLAPDEAVHVRIEASKQKAEGVVEFVSPTADAQSGTTRVRVRIPNPGEAISSGVTCHLQLDVDPRELANSRRAP